MDVEQVVGRLELVITACAAVATQPLRRLLRGFVELAEQLRFLVRDVANRELKHVKKMKLFHLKAMAVEEAGTSISDDHPQLVHGLDA